MAGAVADGQLRRRAGGVRFEVARAEHDAAIRGLLRESVMDGDVALTLEREPNYFVGANIAGAEDETILAMERGKVIGIASCSIRERFVNGTPRRVGYLGELRLAPQTQGRFDVLRRGFQFYAERRQCNPVDVYFTSIASDNARSVRFLERGLSGMPRYEFLTEFVTLLLQTRRGNAKTTNEAAANPAALTRCLNTHGARYQFATCWSEERIRALEQVGLNACHFQGVRNEGEVRASAALWDQRSFKQTVVRGYGPGLKLMRPLLNAAAGAGFGFHLPSTNSALANAFISPLAISPDDEVALKELIERCLHAAGRRGLRMATLGFAAEDPRLAFVRKHFRAREYRTRLYRVHWTGMRTPVETLDGRLLAPEVALL
jgi:hypothetical protein